MDCCNRGPRELIATPYLTAARPYRAAYLGVISSGRPVDGHFGYIVNPDVTFVREFDLSCLYSQSVCRLVRRSSRSKEAEWFLIWSGCAYNRAKCCNRTCYILYRWQYFHYCPYRSDVRRCDQYSRSWCSTAGDTAGYAPNYNAATEEMAMGHAAALSSWCRVGIITAMFLCACIVPCKNG